MNKTGESSLLTAEKILLTTRELQAVLSCGYSSAVKIGNAAQARVTVGKRVLWCREKIELYVSNISK